MAQTITKIKWNEADFKWNDNPYKWNEVQLIQEIIEELDAAGKPTKKGLYELPEEKKKKLIRLILKRKGIKVYDEKKQVKDVNIKIEDVELIIKEVKAQILAENIDV